MGMSRQQWPETPKRSENSAKWMIRHQETSLYLLVDEGGVDAYISGTRNYGTGFDTERAAMKAVERFSLGGKGFVLEPPKK